MPNYVRKALNRFQPILRGGKEYYPHICAPIQYGQKIQYTDPLDATKYLSDKETNLIQQVCGTLLYYAIAIDNTILPALSDISLDQYKVTKNTEKQVTKILNYFASNPNTEIQYRARGTKLAIHSDASYLSVSRARSRASGAHLLSRGPPNPKKPNDFLLTVNRIILAVCKIMRNIMASSDEDEYGTIFINAQTAVPIHITLK